MDRLLRRRPAHLPRPGDRLHEESGQPGGLLRVVQVGRPIAAGAPAGMHAGCTVAAATRGACTLHHLLPAACPARRSQKEGCGSFTFLYDGDQRTAGTCWLKQAAGFTRGYRSGAVSSLMTQITPPPAGAAAGALGRRPTECASSQVPHAQPRCLPSCRSDVHVQPGRLRQRHARHPPAALVLGAPAAAALPHGCGAGQPGAVPVVLFHRPEEGQHRCRRGRLLRRSGGGRPEALGARPRLQERRLRHRHGRQPQLPE